MPQPQSPAPGDTSSSRSTVSRQGALEHSVTEVPLLALEPRILLDAAALATAADTVDEGPADDIDVGSEPTAGDGPDIVQALSDFQAPASGETAVVFIDSAVGDAGDLLAGIDSQVEVVMLEAGRDGVSQITEYLSGRSGISSLHIISHGDIGEVILGSATLSAATLVAYSDALADWGGAISESGDILFYGCKVGQDGKGQAFIETIAEMTGADIAASDDLTGAAALGGDWDLEKSTGRIEAEMAISGEVLEAYDDILATATNDAGPNDASGAFDGGMDFSGGNYLKLGSNIGIDTNTMTVEAWIKLTSDTANNKMIYSVGDTNVRGFFLMVDGNENVVFAAPGQGTLTDGTTLNINQWYHVAATFENNGRDRKIYIDGSLSSTSPTEAAGPTAPVVASTNIGANDDGTETFAGYITEVRVWNTTRTAAEISANKDSSVTVSDADLAAYWKLNDMTGTTAADSHTDTSTTAVKNMTQNNSSETDWLNFTVPTVSASSNSITDAETLTFSSSNFTSAFSDDGGQSLTKIQITSLPDSGTLKLSGTAVSVNDEITLANLSNLTFTPNGVGTTSFNWTGSDVGNFATSSASLSIDVSSGQSASGSGDDTGSGSLALANDVDDTGVVLDNSDLDNDTLTGDDGSGVFFENRSGDNGVLSLNDGIDDNSLLNGDDSVLLDTGDGFSNFETSGDGDGDSEEITPAAVSDEDSFVDGGDEGAEFMDTDTQLASIGDLGGENGFGVLGGPGANQSGPGNSTTNENEISGTSGNQGLGVGEGNAGGDRLTGEHNDSSTEGGVQQIADTSATKPGGGKKDGPGASDTNSNEVSGTTGNQGNDKDVGNAGGQRILNPTPGTAPSGESGGAVPLGSDNPNEGDEATSNTDTGLGGVGNLGGENGFGSLDGPGSSDANENEITGTTGNQGNDKNVGNAGGERIAGNQGTGNDGNSGSRGGQGDSGGSDQVAETDDQVAGTGSDGTPTTTSDDGGQSSSGSVSDQSQPQDGSGEDQSATGNEPEQNQPQDGSGEDQAATGNEPDQNQPLSTTSGENQPENSGAGDAQTASIVDNSEGTDTGLGSIGIVGGDNGFGPLATPGGEAVAGSETQDSFELQGTTESSEARGSDEPGTPLSGQQSADQSNVQSISQPSVEQNTNSAGNDIPSDQAGTQSVAPTATDQSSGNSVAQQIPDQPTSQASTLQIQFDSEGSVSGEPQIEPDQSDAPQAGSGQDRSQSGGQTASPVQSDAADAAVTGTRQSGGRESGSGTGQAIAQESAVGSTGNETGQTETVQGDRGQNREASRGTIGNGEDVPDLGTSLKIPVIEDGDSISLTVPPDIFASEDVTGQTVLRYEAELGDGSPLPGWLSFNDEAGTFFGSPPPGETANLSIRVTAIHSLGDETDVLLELTLNGDEPAEATIKESPAGARPNGTSSSIGLMEQLGQGGIKGFESERTAMIEAVKHWAE